MRLETQRLVLREISDGDFDAIHRFGSDVETTRFMDWGPNTPEDTRNFLKAAQSAGREMLRSEYELAVTLRESGELIGSCGIRVKSTQNKAADFGYCFRRDTWGKGYATEASKALIGFGFDRLKLHRIWATCAPENLASARVLEKAGLKFEGRMRECVFAKGQWRDSLLYAILEAEWIR